MSENGPALVEAMHREAVERLRGQPWPPAEPPTILYTELPEASPDSPLHRAWNTYRQEVGRLLTEGHEGKFVLIKDDAVIGLYDTWRAAREAGLQRYLLNPFLVHQVQTREPILGGCSFLVPKLRFGNAPPRNSVSAMPGGNGSFQDRCVPKPEFGNEAKEGCFLLAALVAASLCLPAWAQPSRNASAPAHEAVWPEREWPTATPESQGLSADGLDALAAYARKYGGGSGCVVRHGRLVKEWGDPAARADVKSATKGAVGTTLLGLAVDAGLVRLDDRAGKYYPALGRERKENAATGWLDRITVRQLATMTAGFDDGRPPRLVYEPGTKGFYSNDTANMLAELLTIRFGEDLRAVFKRKVMAPLGLRDSEWAWRDNQFRAKTVNGLPSREFASGLTITPRALARIGYLYLHEGNWKGKQILSREFVRTATRPTGLPAPYPFYALYWGSNGKGTFADLPRDAFWALGLGDSFVLVCPSLDVVAVRLGTGSVKSQLPGGDRPEDWGKRVAGFSRLLRKAVRQP